MSRKPPNLRQCLAAAIAQLFDIPREHVTAMSCEQLLSLIQTDHDPVPVSVARDLGWTWEQINHPSNLTIRLIPDHFEKTNRRDKPAIAKSKRVTEAHVAFRRRLLAKDGKNCESSVEICLNTPKRKIHSRPFQKAPAGHKHFRRTRP